MICLSLQFRQVFKRGAEGLRLVLGVLVGHGDGGGADAEDDGGNLPLGDEYADGAEPDILEEDA